MPKVVVSLATETAVTRYRCTACGGITRFGVTKTTRTRAYHHFTTGGELTIEEEEILSETIEEVICRWCGHGKNIETFDTPT
jgi:hypothetical protein